MEALLLKEWATKMNNLLSDLKGINAVKSSGTGLVVEITETNEREKNNLITRIESIFENAGADNIPYRIKVVERTKVLA